MSHVLSSSFSSDPLIPHCDGSVELFIIEIQKIPEQQYDFCKLPIAVHFVLVV